MDRLYSGVYDSLETGLSLREAEAPDAWRAELEASLVLDAYISRGLVLTDTMLLDGTFFLEGGPSRIDQLVPREWLRVATRAPSLADSLRGMLFDDTGPRPFWFSGLPSPAESLRVQGLLRGLRDAGGGPTEPFALLAWLRSAAPEHDGHWDRLERGWRGWLTDRRELHTWRMSSYDLASRLADPERRPSGVDRDGPARPLLELIEARRPRAEVYAAYRRGLDAAGPSETAVDLETVWAWYHHAYHAAIADQHDCRRLDVRDPVGARPTSPLQVRVDRMLDRVLTGRERDRSAGGSAVIEFPPGTVDALRQLGAGLREFEREFAHAPDAERLARLADALAGLARTTEHEPRIVRFIETAPEVLLALGVGVGGKALGLEGGAEVPVTVVAHQAANAVLRRAGRRIDRPTRIHRRLMEYTHRIRPVAHSPR